MARPQTTMLTLRPGQRILSIPGFGVTTSRRAVQSAAADWWAVAGKTCVAAYQPKSADDLAASYVNLANPGTYDAAPGTAPSFNAATGWTFNGSTQYLTTGVVTSTGWSALVCFSGWTTATDSYCFGAYDTGTVTLFAITPRDTASFAAWWNGRYPGGNMNSSPSMISGVLAFAAGNVYRDGSPDATPLTNAYAPTSALYLGALNASGSASNFGNGNIQALAIYSDTLTDGEIATVSAAMAAL